MAVIDWWNGPLTLVVIFFALCLLLLTWSIARVACRACHSSGILFSLWHTHTHTHTHTAWCSEMGSLTSLEAWHSGASSDAREPIDLMPDKSWRACGRTRSRLYAFPMHFPTAFGPFASCFLRSRVQLMWIFSSGFVLKHPYIHANAFTCRNPKNVSLWNSYKSERSSSVHH